MGAPIGTSALQKPRCTKSRCQRVADGGRGRHSGLPDAAAGQKERSTGVPAKDHEDWRVTEGPSIGAEPEFTLSDIRLGANFFVTGAMSRNIAARLSTATPTVVESSGRRLADMCGTLRIHDSQFLDEFRGVDLGGCRGVLALLNADEYVVEIFLPPDQFESLLPLLAPAPARAELLIEIERTLDQAVFEELRYFWDDRRSPTIPFNEFKLSVVAG